VLFEKQAFQETCVQNIIKILDDTDIRDNDFSNLSKAIQKLNSDNKQTQFITCQKNKIDILMETGTGKTFTYLKTIFELNKTYGRTKFIIAVPRDAIKAGVIQNITLTKEYFFNDYQTHLNIIEYPKDGISKIEHDFLNNNSKITILIITNSAFNKKDNLINRLPENGNLFINGTIWENIAKQNPIVIIDGKVRVISSTPLYNHLTVSKKKSVNIRLDEDIIEWLKTQSNQYQTHINAVLRAYYEANKSNKQS
jgi:type III restriction enzyme